MKIEIKTIKGTVFLLEEETNDSNAMIRYDVDKIIKILKEITTQIKDLEK